MIARYRRRESVWTSVPETTFRTVASVSAVTKHVLPLVLAFCFIPAFAATNQTASQTLTLTVAAQPTITTTTATLPAAVVGVAYSATLEATGGDPPYTWTSGGAGLPSGLTLASAGVLSGTVPASACSTGTCEFPVTFTVTDSANNSASATIDVTVVSELTITTTALPQEFVGVAYSATLTASGGVPPYSWSVGSGLPAGLTLSSAGVLSGTVTSTTCSQASCSYSFTITVTDSSSTAQIKRAHVLSRPAPKPKQ